jgi:intracellular multiplication protein IcmC
MKKINTHGFILALGAVFILFSNVVFAQNTPAVTRADALQMLINLSNAYPALWQMMTALCYIIGFAFAVRGIYYLKMYGELRTMMASQTSLKIPIVYFIVSAVLIYIPSAFRIFNTTFFGYGSPLAYNDVSSSLSPMAMKAIVGLVQFVGLISFIRGWLILVAHAQQPGGQASLGKALTHIIGGLLAINIIGVGQVIWSTFGFTFSL